MHGGSARRIGLIALLATLVLVPVGVASAKKDETFKVCKHGCDFSKIQKAVNASDKDDTIKVKPGTYKEAVLISGHGHDGLTIKGTKSDASKVKLNGKQNFNNGIESTKVNDLTLRNFTVKNYVGNGVFVNQCKNYLMKNLRAAFNRAYGLFAFDCIGGRMTKSVGYGHGDSAFYIGATPFQDNPKTTNLDHLEAYQNVLGYSGTNSKYVNIHDSDFYNNGTGIVPNTLDSEPYEPSGSGIIEDNNIFWNNFNYFLPDSPVKTVSNGLGQLGDLTVQYPTGVGVLLLGSDGWTTQNNEIFGNFKYGSVALSFPPDLNEGDDAINRNNQFLNNTNGRGGTDTNAVDFYNDGSGSGNCFAGNVSSTFDPSPTATDAFLYPGCPAPPPPASGTGTSTADLGQLGDIAYALVDPPQNQQCSWTAHPHPPFEDFEPYEVPGFDPEYMPVARASLIIALVATTAFAALATASDRTGSTPPARKTVNVSVADDYYAPAKVKIKKDQKVKWRWDDFNFNTHNVTLTDTRPDGVKKGDFTSTSATTNFSFAKKFKTPGKYGFVCTLHKTVMTMTVQVKKN